MTCGATVEDGALKLLEAVRLPENARVYVVVPGVEEVPRVYIASPRLAQPVRAADFAEEGAKEPQEARSVTSSLRA